MNTFEIVQTTPADADALAALQAACFPTLDPIEWFSAEMYRSQVAHFSDGQFCAKVQTPNGTLAIAATTTFLTTQAFIDSGSYYFDVIGQGYLTTHDPNGEWLYGVDVSVHPDYRRLGIGSQLYQTRRDLVRRLGLQGEIVPGLLPGYGAHRDTLTVPQYVDQVVAGTLIDPTLTWQLQNGFKVARLLQGYIRDSRSDDWCTLLIRERDA